MWGSFDGIPDDWSRPDEKVSENIVVGLIGNSPTKLLGVNKVITGTDSKGKYTESNAVKYIDFYPYYKNITHISYTYYRVNAFNHKRAQYTVSNLLSLHAGPWNSNTIGMSYPINYLNVDWKDENVDNYKYNH
jgi:hypothetical protein